MVKPVSAARGQSHTSPTCAVNTSQHLYYTPGPSAFPLQLFQTHSQGLDKLNTEAKSSPARIPPLPAPFAANPSVPCLPLPPHLWPFFCFLSREIRSKSRHRFFQEVFLGSSRPHWQRLGRGSPCGFSPSPDFHSIVPHCGGRVTRCWSPLRSCELPEGRSSVFLVLFCIPKVWWRA